MTDLARFTTLEGLALALLDRRKTIGLSQLLVDELAGLQNGYTGKIEAEAKHPGRGKGLGKTSIPLLLGALKVDLVLVPAVRPSRTQGDGNAHSANYFQRRTAKASAARWANTTPKQRSKAARAAAKARWRAVKAERERK